MFRHCLRVQGGIEKHAFFRMNKTRTRTYDPLLRKRRTSLRATDYVRKWIYEDTAFERLNPLE